MAALVEAMSGNLRLAAELAGRSGLHADDSGDSVAPLCPAAALALAWACTDRYDLQTAGELLGHAERAAPSLDARPLGAVLALLRARLLCAHGEFALARARLRAVRTSADGARSTGWLDRTLVLAQGSSYLAEGNPQQAVATLGSDECDDLEARLLRKRALRAAGADAGADTGADNGEPPTPSPTEVATAPLASQVARWLVRAGEATDEQAPSRAEVCLDRALRLAGPEHLRRPFFEAPADVRELLERHGRSARSRWLRTGVPGTAVLGLADGPGENGRPRTEADSADTVENPLTAKEQEVLGYLADLLTTEEIARTMFVSVNTVRSHVRSILRKLGVSRRNEAVRRAWEMKLLTPRGAA
jgi:LuxR family maltose regulon positive regulatory protein